MLCMSVGLFVCLCLSVTPQTWQPIETDQEIINTQLGTISDFHIIFASLKVILPIVIFIDI